MTNYKGIPSIIAACTILAATAVYAQNVEPAANAEKAPRAPLPILRLDAKGPLSQITALAFTPDGETLYAAGWDKAIYAWTLDKNNEFQLAPGKALRIPIGPGVRPGLINALAISSDGRYLAVAGYAKGSHIAGFTEGGLMWPASTLSLEHRREIGTIYVFDLKSETQPAITYLRGHTGPIAALAFPKQSENQAPVLVSAGDEYDEKTGKALGGVRVWNINQPAAPIASYFDLTAHSDDARIPRTVAAVRKGNDPKAVHVGIAWGENVLRIWDVMRDQVVKVDNTTSVSCAGVGDQFLLAGGHRQGKDFLGWHLGLWKPPVGQNAAPVRVEPSIRPPNSADAPLGIATDHETNTALVVCMMQPGKDVGFFLADSQTLKRVPEGTATIAIGDTAHWPAFAISGNGKFVAVAGNRDRKIQVYPVAENTRALGKMQVLEAQGDYYPRVRFFAKEDSLGLGLNTDFNSDAPEILFDITAGKIADKAGWKPASGREKANFTAKFEKQENRDTILTQFPDRSSARIILPEKQLVQQMALCPKTDAHPPLVGVIVKSPDFAETVLRIYDAKTGQRLRELSGHTDRVTSITFSEDGKRMASAGQDRTIRVWWLEDLKDHIGEAGFLDGLALSDVNGAATVKEIDEHAAQDLRGQLQEGDVIEAFTNPEKKLVETKKAVNFFYYLSTVAPGQTIELQVRRNGQILAPRPKVKVQQAVDERKPLFTLFFNKSDVADAGKSWIGWSPMGNFDSSDAKIEELVGWHFNPTGPDAYSTLVQIGEYREKNFKKGVLKNLSEYGKPEPPAPPLNIPEPNLMGMADPPVPAAAQKPRKIPKLSLFIKAKSQPEVEEAPFEVLTPDALQQIWTKSNQIKAVLTVKDAEMPAGEVKSHLAWQLDGKTQEWDVIEPTTGEFELDLSGYAWKPMPENKPYVLRVAFLTDDPNQPEYFREQKIVFAPPPPPPKPPEKFLPRPFITAPTSHTVVYDATSEKEVSLTVELSPPAEGEIQAGRMTFERKTKDDADFTPVLQNGQPLAIAFDVTTRRISETVPLENGTNQIRVRLAAGEGEEKRVSDEVVVHYRRPPRVEALQAKAEVEHARAEVSCKVSTPADLPILQWLLLVNQKMYIVPNDQVAQQQDPADNTRWDITIKNVLISEGDNAIRVIPRNADGRVLTAPKIVVNWKKFQPPQGPPPTRPKIYFENVNDQVPLAGKWPGDEFTVAFNVLASTELQWVKVYYNGKQVATPELPKPKDGMKYEFRLPIKLEKEENDFRVVVLDKNILWNENQVPLKVLTPPVRLVIDQLDVQGEGVSLTPESSYSSKITFNKPVPTSDVVLRGRVVTSDSTMKFQRPFLKCWVNGSLQWARAVPVPNKPTEWRFAAKLMLNQEENVIRVQFPEAAKEITSPTECKVTCRNPNTEQKLHLVLVGIDPDNPRDFKTENLVAAAKQAFGINALPAGNGLFKNPEVHVIPRAEVRASVITAKLMALKVSKEEPEKGEQDLIVFFYQGEEIHNKDRVIFKTFDKIDDGDVLTYQGLKDLLGEIYGAHLLLLDVAMKNQTPAERGPAKDDDPLGVLRTVHSGQMPNNQPFPQMSALGKVLPQITELGQLTPQVKDALPQAKVVGDIHSDLKHRRIGTKNVGAKVVGAGQ